MADAYTGFPALLEEKAVAVLKADTTFLWASGVRTECKTIESGLRASFRQYSDEEDLPAVGLTAEVPEEADPAALGTDRHVALLAATVVVRDADAAARRTLALDIGWRIRRQFLNQTEGGAWDDLTDILPDADPGSTETKVSGPIVDDLGTGEERTRSNTAIATVVATVAVDVLTEIST